MDKRTRYAPEVWKRAVRLVLEHEREYPSQVEGDSLDSREGPIGLDSPQ